MKYMYQTHARPSASLELSLFLVDDRGDARGTPEVPPERKYAELWTSETLVSSSENPL